MKQREKRGQRDKIKLQETLGANQTLDHQIAAYSLQSTSRTKPKKNKTTESRATKQSSNKRTTESNQVAAETRTTSPQGKGQIKRKWHNGPVEGGK